MKAIEDAIKYLEWRKEDKAQEIVRELKLLLPTPRRSRGLDDHWLDEAWEKAINDNPSLRSC